MALQNRLNHNILKPLFSLCLLSSFEKGRITGSGAHHFTTLSTPQDAGCYVLTGNGRSGSASLCFLVLPGLCSLLNA